MIFDRNRDSFIRCSDGLILTTEIEFWRLVVTSQLSANYVFVVIEMSMVGNAEVQRGTTVNLPSTPILAGWLEIKTFASL
jgi:hypothetical protein